MSPLAYVIAHPETTAKRLYLAQARYALDMLTTPYADLPEVFKAPFEVMARNIAAALIITEGHVPNAARMLAFHDPGNATWGLWRTRIITAHPDLR